MPKLKAKDLIKAEFESVGGIWDESCRVRKIKGAEKFGPPSYHLLWEDGQILRRDTYEISGNEVTLYMMEKRYGDTPRYFETNS